MTTTEPIVVNLVCSWPALRITLGEGTPDDTLIDVLGRITFGSQLSDDDVIPALKTFFEESGHTHVRVKLVLGPHFTIRIPRFIERLPQLARFGYRVHSIERFTPKSS